MGSFHDFHPINALLRTESLEFLPEKACVHYSRAIHNVKASVHHVAIAFTAQLLSYEILLDLMWPS